VRVLRQAWSHAYSDPGYFERGDDRLYLSIAEDFISPEGKRLNPPSWQWQRVNGKPSGQLVFSFYANRYGPRDTKQWSETAKLPLEKCLAQVASAIRNHFVDAQERREREAIESAKRHAEWLERTRLWQQEQAIRLQQENERKHAEALAAAVQARKAALLKAAQNWQLSRVLSEYITECESRWKSQSPELSPPQTAWLTWAREIAAATSPFSAGYPDPANDGTLDPAPIPIGGPYPPTRHFK